MTTAQFRYYVSLFRSRSDVYARYWQKGTAAGYSPAYTFDWPAFNAHRATGGRLQDFKNKETAPLTMGVFLRHIRGELAIGVYPMLADNTCCFLAADFDGANWFNDCQTYIKACHQVQLKPCLERSRSGKGGHVWLFFQAPYSCSAARRIGMALIARSTPSDALTAQASFDRLFPNQDIMPRGGYGNLIALPLQGQAMTHGNSLFLDPVTKEAYADQWAYIETIHKHDHAELDRALNKLDVSYSALQKTNPLFNASRASLSITVKRTISLPREQVSPLLLGFLRERLNFLNGEYLAKKRLGKPIYDVQKYFQLLNETAEHIVLPRGFLSQLLRFLTEQHYPYTLTRRHACPAKCTYDSQLSLMPEQERMVRTAMQTQEGILVAPPGSGKTMMALEIIARQQRPALVLVHRRQLLEQWVERIETYLNIPRAHIGVFAGGAKRIGERITVASLQTVARVPNLEAFGEAFGTVIIDECHHVPAKTFRQVVAHLNPTYMYGLTATIARKHKDEQLLYSFVGEVIDKMSMNVFETESSNVKVMVHKTDLHMPFQWKSDQFELLAKVICFDSRRNQKIVADITDQVRMGRRVMVLSERKEHLKILELYMKGSCDTLVLTGEDTANVRSSKLKTVKNGGYQVLLATGQLIGEGLEVANIEALVLAFPFSFEGKLIQYAGRLSHCVQPKALIDYHDEHVVFLDRQFKQRRRHYRNVAGR